MLTQNRLKELLSYNQDTGIFTRLVMNNHRFPIGSIAGQNHHSGYVYLEVDKKVYSSHRLAWLYVYGEFPKNVIDHINGNKSDNRICNLRDVTRSVNLQNLVKPYKVNSSGFIGVSFHKSAKKWIAQISAKGRKIHLGCYQTPEEAHKVYVDTKRKLHQGCTI